MDSLANVNRSALYDWSLRCFNIFLGVRNTNLLRYVMLIPKKEVNTLRRFGSITDNLYTLEVQTI